MKSRTLLMVVVTLLVLGGIGMYATGSFDNLQGRFKTSGNELTVDVGASTPRADIVVGGQSKADFSTYTFTSSTDPITVNKLAVAVKGTEATAVSLVTLEFEDSSGATVQEYGYVSAGRAVFTGLDFYIAAASSANLEIYGDINATGSGAWTSGDREMLALDLNDFEAINMNTGTTYSSWSFTKTTTVNSMQVYATKPTITLATTSPSGSRSVSASDSVFVMDMDLSADSTSDATVKSIKFTLAANGDIDTYASPTTAYLKQGSTTLATANLVSDTAGASVTSTATVNFILTTPLTLSATASAASTLTLQIDSASLLAEDSGVDDPLTVTVNLGTASTKGDVIWNDGSKDVRWFGNLSSTTLMGNTLNY